MSRAKELQEKLNLQAKLQSTFSNNTAAVLDWLKESDETGISNDTERNKQLKDHKELEDGKKAFFKLASRFADWIGPTLPHTR